MRRKILLLACLLSVITGSAQSVEKKAIDKGLKKAIYEIIQLSAEDNTAEIDRKYVHPEFGIYDVFRIGVPDTFKQHSSIAFAFPTQQNSSIYPNLKEIPSVHSTYELTNYNAVFDCNEMVWDREGLFVTDSISYPKLSEVIEQSVFEGSEFPESLHKQAKYIEENSYRIVLTEFDIIFYLTKIGGNWYLTLFDRVTTDCSA